MPHPLLNEWNTNSTLLRIAGGVDGLAFDTLCRIKTLSLDRMVLVWAEGDSRIVLTDAVFESHDISEASLDRRLPEEAEWSRQLIIRWPSKPHRLCILFEQREAS